MPKYVERVYFRTYLLRRDIVQAGKYVTTFKYNLLSPSPSKPNTETAGSPETSTNLYPTTGRPIPSQPQP